MNSRGPRFACTLALLLAAPAALAQREGSSYLSWVGPEVSLVSVAEDDGAARPNMPLLAGDRIVTGPSSRAEAILADGNVLRVDVRTNLRLDRLARTFESDDERNSIFLERGAVVLEHRWGTSREEATRIDTDDVTVLLPDRGLLRVDVGRRGTEVYVVSGRAEVYARSGRATLRTGQYAFASPDADLELDWLEPPRDGFTRFVAERRDLGDGEPADGYVSADYAYDYAVAGFDRYGSWVWIGGVGSYCWRPSVAAGWRPYVDGYWRWSPAGLTWVSYEPWGWMPYHYGTWIWDAGFGWCWSPGVAYSPAWVYWTYTPTWVGWCPVGYYGGYYGGTWGGHHGTDPGPTWDRSGRKRSGSERWTLAYPHLRGRVDVARIDPRGWSYVPVNRIGTRFDSRRDVLGHDRVGFRPDDRGIVATAPLRIDRGRSGSTAAAVQEAVRRVPADIGREIRASGNLGDLTPVLRRDAALPTATRDELRRAFVTPGRDPAYRPLPATDVVAPPRTAGGSAAAPPRGGSRSDGSTTALPSRGTETTIPSRGPASSEPREAWRDGSAAAAPRPSADASGEARRDVEPPLSGGFGRDRDVRGDDGWSSPRRAPAPGSTSPSRSFDVPPRRPEAGVEDSPTQSARPAPDQEPWRESSPATTRREPPAPRGDEGWRGGETRPRTDAAPSGRAADVPRSAPAPRAEAPPARSDGAARSAPAPRNDPPPSRSWEAPPPRSAPAPRTEAPPARTYEAPRAAPAPRNDPPPSRSLEAPRREAPAAPSAPPPSAPSGTATHRTTPEGG